MLYSFFLVDVGVAPVAQSFSVPQNVWTGSPSRPEAPKTEFHFAHFTKKS